MTEKEDIRRYSLEELKQLRAQGKTRTRADAPVFPLDDGFWELARVIMPSSKTSVHLRLDSDVLEWFRARAKAICPA